MTDFNQLLPQEQEERLLKLAYQSLEAWNVKGELSLIKQRENAVYRLHTDAGERYALRVHRANYHSDAALKSELTWIRALADVGLGVPAAIPTTCGDYFAKVSVDEVPEPRQVDLLSWVEGDQIGSIEDGLGDDPQAIRHIYLTIGRVAAQVHNHSSAWAVPQDFRRHSWDVDGLVGEQPFWGPFWELQSLTEEQRELMIKARVEVRQDLIEFGQSTADYSLIHADFVPENVLVDGDKVQIIDFDDAGFGWHLFELATALYFIQPDKNYAIARDALLEGYREQRPLADEKLAKLPLFLAARSLTYLGWVHTRPGTETAIELEPMLVDMCCKTVTAYLAGK